MSILDHIRRCNVHDLSGFRPFRIGGARVGWVRPAVEDVLMRLGGRFEARDGAVAMADRFEDFADRSALLDEAGEAIVAAGLARKLRTELFGVTNIWGRPPVAAINRGVAPAFGFAAYGVHLNGWRRRDDGGQELWIGRRALDKAVAPGKLDNMVAGGQPLGLGLMENLVKEAGEEASLPAALARRAIPVGCISYVMESDEGLKPETMFCYDLEVPCDFAPVNADGELMDFRLMPADAVRDAVATGDDFKFNVNLVIADFSIRHGLITPDAEPDYAAIVSGLRQGFGDGFGPQEPGGQDA